MSVCILWWLLVNEFNRFTLDADQISANKLGDLDFIVLTKNYCTFNLLRDGVTTDKEHWFVMSPFCRPILDDPEIVNTLPPIPLAKIPPPPQHSKIGGRVENIPAAAAHVIPLMELFPLWRERTSVLYLWCDHGHGQDGRQIQILPPPTDGLLPNHQAKSELNKFLSTSITVPHYRS